MIFFKYLINIFSFDNYIWIIENQLKILFNFILIIKFKNN
jgi:hypothetical protein